MIPRAITACRKAAPWPDNTPIEQDLVLSRALVELFRRPVLAEGAVFRGDTTSTPVVKIEINKREHFALSRVVTLLARRQEKRSLRTVDGKEAIAYRCPGIENDRLAGAP